MLIADQYHSFSDCGTRRPPGLPAGRQAGNTGMTPQTPAVCEKERY